MSYSGAESWAGYEGVGSAQSRRGGGNRRDRQRYHREDRDYDDRRGHLNSNHGSDYRSEYRNDTSDHYGGRHRPKVNRYTRNAHAGGHADDHRGHHDDRVDHGERDDHERPNRRYSESDETTSGKGGREKGQGKGNRARSMQETWLDSHTSSSVAPASTPYTGLPMVPSQTYESISTPSAAVPPSSRQSPGDDLICQATRVLDEYDVGGLNRVLMRLAKVENLPGARQDPKWKELLERTSKILSAPTCPATSKDLADMAFALGKLQMQDNVVNDLLHVVAELAKFRLEHFTAHDMSGMVWGFASLGIRNEALMSVTAAEVVNKIASFDQRQLSNTAWAFAKCGLWNEQLVNAIASECLAKISTFTSQSLSHISWAMAQWGTRREDLMDIISCEAQRKIADFAPPSLAMTAWSFASLQLKSAHLMSAISKEAIAKIVHFKTQDLAHLAWAFANLRVQDVQLFDVMAEEIRKHIKGTLPPELSNIAWGFSKNGLPNESLMNVIANEAIIQIRAFKPAEIAMLTWAFAVAGLQNKELMTEIGGQVGKHIDSYSAPQLSHIAWAFGALSLRHTEFLTALSTFVHSHMDAFKAQGLSNIAWALAMVTFRDDTLLRRIAPEIAKDVAELRPLALARCAWAYRVLTVQCPHLMAAVVSESAKKIDDFPTKALAKLVDAVFVVPQAKDAALLERALEARTKEVVDTIIGAIGKGATLNEQEYTQGLTGLGLVDAGLVGTPAILKRLDIDMPSLEFVDRCTQEAEQYRNITNPEIAAAQVALSWCTGDEYSEIQWTWEDFIVRHNSAGGGYDSPAQINRKIVNRSTCDVDEAVLPLQKYDEKLFLNQGLVAVDLGGRSGCSEVLFSILCAIHARLTSFSQDVNIAITGTVQLFSSIVPSLSAIGALQQFRVLYQGISIEFAEKIGAMED